MEKFKIEAWLDSVIDSIICAFVCMKATDFESFSEATNFEDWGY